MCVAYTGFDIKIPKFSDLIKVRKHLRAESSPSFRISKRRKSLPLTAQVPPCAHIMLFKERVNLRLPFQKFPAKTLRIFEILLILEPKLFPNEN